MTRTQREPRVLSLVCPTGGGYITSHAAVTFFLKSFYTYTSRGDRHISSGQARSAKTLGDTGGSRRAAGGEPLLHLNCVLSLQL